jgi:succinoglycan biosynthesis transport protein ExoP
MPDDKVQIERIPPGDAPLTRPRYPRPLGDQETYSYGPGYGPGYGYGRADEGEFNLRELWRKVRKRKWLVISIVVIATTAVALEMYRTKSTYQASAMIEIGKERPANLKSGAVVIQNSDDADTIKTRILEAKSLPVLEDVVRNLKLDQDSAFKDNAEKESLVHAVKGLISRSNKPDPAPAADPALLPVPATNGDPSKDDARLEPYALMVQGGLAVDQVPNTRAIRISYTHTNPEEAATVANGVAKSMIDLSFKSDTEQFTNTSEWLKTSTRELLAKVEQAEQALANYTREHNIFSADTKGGDTLTTEKLARLHDQATRAQTDRILKESLYQEVKAGRVAQLPEAFIDSRLSALQAKLGELQTREAELSVRYGPKNPHLAEVREQITSIQQQLDSGRTSLESKLKADYDRAVRDEQALNAALAQAKGEAVKQNQDAIQFGVLKQDVETNKALYQDFLQKTNQANLEVAQQHSNMRVLQPARKPGSPVAPDRLRTILIGFIFSFGMGIGLVLFLEYLDNTIKSVEDVSRYVQLPALGVIPMISNVTPRQLRAAGEKRKPRARAPKEKDSLAVALQSANLVAFDTRSSAAEAYRALRTSVLLSAAGQPPKTLLITSGQPGEGKTTTVVNTAISLAQLGASVLIIDCDLRKPAIHKMLGAEHAHGLSNYLSRDVELGGLIQKLQMPNLSLLACGPIPPNPAELISSDKMRKMLAELADRYDHILIDSPPLMNVTDPVILSTMVDGVMLVVSWGKSTREVAQRVRMELTSVGAKIFGVVLNNVDLRREGYDDYYYYRYYSYGQHRDEASS